MPGKLAVLPEWWPAMSDLILHHYPTSPFAEKARLMLGFKGLSWRSVMIPPVMPKPDLVALTGGYRRTPVLQVGADIYCDTAMIARRLEQQKSSPPLYPEGQEMVVACFAAWVDSVVFQHAVSLVFQPESIALRFARLTPEQVQGFLADRAALFSGGTATRLPVEQAKHQWPSIMSRLQQQLSRSPGDFLFGEPSLADCSLAHCLWFLKATPVTAPLVDAYPDVLAWFERVMGFGHGAPSDLSADDALSIARETAVAALPDEAFIELNGLHQGARVIVAATDYGVDTVEGELVFAGVEEIIVQRSDDRAGTVNVHFPRLGFSLKKA
jgi:glutathione S-transferase